ncbi:UDP-glycosyltransferase UGT5-like [Pieris napi]|uniref:UDP-glycosyltransferase UGT5-like n=1 Tax=Pieris napi TaxID=78633 RepID=UPI001FBA6A48|nr:UDP-glycosyltransferase UGT5-like [Pieris napi]
MLRQVGFVLLIFVITNVHSAKIIAVFPTPSVSHQVVFRPLALELAKRGHHITIITTDPFTQAKNPNITEIDVHDISYELWKKYVVLDLEFGNKDNIYPQVEVVPKVMMHIICSQLEQDSVQKLINSKESFDLLILEGWLRQNLIYSHIFKAPVILMSSFGAMFARDEVNVGAPTHPFLYPMLIQQRLYNMSFWEKIQELYKRQWFDSFWYASDGKEVAVFREKIDKDLPDYEELSKNINMLFINTHPMWINNQPLPPNVVTLWGIHKHPQKPLPNDLQTYLDSSKNGVIYLSFGSNALSSILSPEKIQIFVRVFSRLSYDILWKWETDELPGKSENIKISKWLPQSDLLRHPNIKLFITQGGLQSTDEAITAEVPMIAVPLLGDQWFNAEKYLYYKIGMKLDMETITEDELDNAISTVINDTSYRDNIRRFNDLLHDQPQSALDRAAWWTEYVIRHGGAKHLRSIAANLPWTEYYEIYFVLKLTSLLLSIIFGVLVVVYLVWRRLFTKEKLKSA